MKKIDAAVILFLLATVSLFYRMTYEKLDRNIVPLEIILKNVSDTLGLRNIDDRDAFAIKSEEDGMYLAEENITKFHNISSVRPRYCLMRTFQIYFKVRMIKSLSWKYKKKNI